MLGPTRSLDRVCQCWGLDSGVCNMRRQGLGCWICKRSQTVNIFPTWLASGNKLHGSSHSEGDAWLNVGPCMAWGAGSRLWQRIMALTHCHHFGNGDILGELQTLEFILDPSRKAFGPRQQLFPNQRTESGRLWTYCRPARAWTQFPQSCP